MRVYLFICFLFFTAAFCQIKKNITVQIGKNINKIFISNEIIDSNSINLTSESILPNYRFAVETNTIYFAEEIDSGTTINIEYFVLFDGVAKNYGLNLMKMPKKDANLLISDSTILSLSQNPNDTNKIKFEGTKTIGASVGSNGEMSMEQSLFVEIYGQIDSNTTLTAHINDQSSSLDGQTSELGELDRIFLRADSKKWSAIAGDLEVSSGEKSLLKEFYTPKGLFAETKNDSIGRTNSAFAGILGTKSGYNKFEGVSGVQNGRFNLRPNSNAAISQIIAGSVRVLIDGELLMENDDYVVDYELSSLRFNANRAILQGQIIEAHYKYRDFAYNSFVAGTQNKFSLLDSTLNVEASLFFDNDVFSSSEREWSKNDLELLQNAGNISPKLLLGNKVHRNDVLKVQAYERLYSLKDEIYSWVSNPEDIFLEEDLYTVNFQIADSDEGDYLPLYSYYFDELSKHYSKEFLEELLISREKSNILGDVFLFVGNGNGIYTALGEISLPTRSVKGEIAINYNPSTQLSMNIIAAGENFDKNTQSKIDNKHRNSLGLKADFSISSAPEQNFLVKNDFSSVNAGEAFVNKILDNYELDNKWSISTDSTQYSLWENMVYAGPHKYFLVKGGYGRGNAEGGAGNSKLIVDDNEINTQRISGGIESGDELPFIFDYLFAKKLINRNFYDTDGRQQTMSVGFDIKKFDLNVGIDEKFDKFLLNQTDKFYYLGEVTPKLSVENKDNTLGTSFQYKRTSISETQKHIDGKFESFEYLLSANADVETGDNHRITTDASVIYNDKKETNFLLSLFDRVYAADFSKGIDTRLNLSVENRSENRWEYIKVPEGTGTHIKDTLTGNFVEYPFGDYAAREIFVYEEDDSRWTTNNFSIYWYNKIRSLSLSGNFTAESKSEIIDKFYQYIPVLANFHKKLEEKVLYSNVFYEQFLSFLPTNAPQISYNLQAGIGKSNDLENIRQYLDLKHNFLYKWNRFHFGAENSGFIEKKTNESSANNYDYTVRDINLKPSEIFVVLNFLHLFVEETVGFMSNNKKSGNYTAVRPGVRFLPKNYGTAELSYEYARVNFDGELFYNMAGGFAKDDNHRISAMLGIKANDNIRFSGFVRGDKNSHTINKWRFSASLNAEIAI